MANSDADFADDLNRYLDALAAHEAPPSNGLLPPEPELAATIQHLRVHDDAPSVDPHFTDQLLESLMPSSTLPTAIVFPSPSRPADDLGAHQAWPPLVRPGAARPESLWRPLATAVFLLLVLGGSLIALGPLRPHEAANLPILPALSGTPDAAPGIMSETLIDVADVPLPPSHAQAYATITELQPGVSVVLVGLTGTSAYNIEQGTVRITYGDVERVLQSGDIWSAPATDKLTFENVGDDAARIVEAGAMDATVFSSTPASPEGAFSDPFGGSETYVLTDATTFAGGMGHMVLERLTLPPDSVLSPYVQPRFAWIGVDAGRVGVTLEGERLPFRWDSGEERSYGVSQSPPIITPGTRVTLRNADHMPLVLYRLTIEPGDAMSTPAASPTP